MENIRDLLKVFEEISEKLSENGWFISEPESPKWWGGALSPEEVIISAILVQQTKWERVSEVMAKLRQGGLNTLKTIAELNPLDLANALSGVNFRFTKASRLVRIARTITSMGGLRALSKLSDDEVRVMLLSMDGVGYETADSIMLFALNRVTIPISTYTIRVIKRIYGYLGGGYEDWRLTLMKLLPRGLYEYKLFHAGVVTTGKEWCLKETPRCIECPLRNQCRFAKLGTNAY
ncbi:endonuclease III domain-containing protein [Caldivirga maquilingensis]|uniref:HhH-GPD family protein n=1 Tax=Caldivirga maquilingensis (strain ATCC 700844 / DSM 13496 / JCM 10307 / IC-167) TaxID=397948 RepID=A8MCI5_CALMQ|nr:DNA repair protein [Caldivirga maquilingensis]ABW01491.1 HhH-GPD family protein [Caldivirga maquilingensis IC-167]